MSNNESLQDFIRERNEVQRALQELDGWYAERRRTFMSLQAYIQDELRSGRITECQKQGTGNKYLTRRMIATLGVDSKMVFRSLLLLNLRRKQMQKRLESLNSILAENEEQTAQPKTAA